MSLPVLQPRLLYGLRTDVQDNIQCITDEDLIYPIGSVVAIHNFTQRRQKLIKLTEKGKHVTLLALSPSKRLLAVVERGEKACITLYDPVALRKKRQIFMPIEREGPKEIVSVAFTYDSKNVMCVTGEPEWQMYNFKTEKGKLETSCKANNLNGTGTVVQVACNPNDNNVVVVVGPGVFRILACSEQIWRQYGFSKADQLNLTCVAWLNQDRVITGTNDGKLLIVESGELKAIFWAGDLPIINLKVKEDVQQASQTSIAEPSTGSAVSGEDYEIRCMVTFPRGFAFAYLNGTVHLYEKEANYKYKKRNIFKVPDRNVIRKEEDKENILNVINALCINISQDRLFVTCKQSQIYVVRLWGPDLTTAPDIPFTELGPSLHQGPIGGMALCTWKPIMLTSGAWDRTLKIWNYETEALELFKEYQEDVYGVTLHPSGLYAVVGFSDKLRFLTLLVDDFAITREFPIRNCKECSFSTHGHIFAAVNGNVIQVYSTIHFENIFNLKGHNGRVRSISFSRSDIKMVSCGTEGAVYEWDLPTKKRVAETIVKVCSFACTAVAKNGKSEFAVGSDGYIREMQNSNVQKEAFITETGLDTIVLSNIDTMLFASGNDGAVYSVKMPLVNNAEFTEYVIHSCRITKLLITYDDKYVITCSDDGMICIWKVTQAEGKVIRIDKDFVPSSDILIAKDDLEEKLESIKTLQLRIHEMDTEFAYQVRQNTVVHNQLMKDVHEGYCAAIEELKEKNEQLEVEHVQEINHINIEIGKMKQEHEHFVQKLEASYNEKLIAEYDKYLRLEDKTAKMRKQYEKQLEETREDKITTIEDLTNSFVQKLREKEVQVEEMVEQMVQKTKEHELIKQQIEDDADREIYEMKTSNEKDLKDEQDINVRLRGESGMIKKKLVLAQKETDELKHAVYILENEHSKFKGVINSLEKDITDLKTEISERDGTIQEKERRIFELKSKNQELEKFKFILDFKIKELKSQIEPKESQIREQTEQIGDMVNELENLQKIIMNLEIQLGELREKLCAADNELKREISKNREAKAALKSIRTDIHATSGLIQDVPKLTKALKELYHRYNADKDFRITQAEDTDAKNEFLRQRDFLERTVKTLQQQVVKSYTAGGGDKIRLVDENAALITETVILRKELKNEQRNNKKMSSVLGLSGKYMLPRAAQKRLNDAVATRTQIHEEYKNRLQDDESCIIALKDENHRLVLKINEDREEQDKQEKK